MSKRLSCSLRLMKQPIATLLLTAAASVAIANPALIGVEASITTVGELRAKYDSAEMIAERTTEFDGPIYAVSGEGAGVEGMHEARFIFNRNGVPVAMTGVFERDRFDHINLILGTRYKLLRHNNRPGVEHRFRNAWYETDDRANTIVSITSPEGSDKAYLTYANQATRNRIEAALEQRNEPEERYWWN